MLRSRRLAERLRIRRAGIRWSHRPADSRGLSYFRRMMMDSSLPERTRELARRVIARCLFDGKEPMLGRYFRQEEASTE